MSTISLAGEGPQGVAVLPSASPGPTGVGDAASADAAYRTRNRRSLDLWDNSAANTLPPASRPRSPFGRNARHITIPLPWTPDAAWHTWTMDVDLASQTCRCAIDGATFGTAKLRPLLTTTSG